MSLIATGMALMKYAPMVAGWLGGDDAEDKAKEVVGIAQTLTGTKDPDSALSMLEKNPEMAVRFQEAVNARDIEMAREDTKRIQAVNKTMQEEGKSEHWPQWAWRPFNGFLFGITLFMNYGLPPIANMFITAFGDAKTSITVNGVTTVTEAAAHLTPGTIPEWVFLAWASVLGVSAWHRGAGKREAAGGPLKNPLAKILNRNTN
jgi:hypothetical protein